MFNLPPDPDRDPKFVKVFLENGDALDAVKRAGYAVHMYDARDIADHLLDQPHIKAAIVAAQPRVRAPIDITRDSLISDLETVFDNAMLEKDYTPAIAAKKTQATLLGMVQDNVQVTHRFDVASMSDEQIIRMMQSRQKKMIDITPEPVGIGQINGPR